jgi:hypothetical protein
MMDGGRVGLGHAVWDLGTHAVVVGYFASRPTAASVVGLFSRTAKQAGPRERGASANAVHPAGLPFVPAALRR